MTEKNPFIRKRRFKFLTAEEIFAMPDPEYLIDDFIPENSLAQLYGESGLGKTFVALDMALSIATGTYWMSNREVLQGPVVYFAAEGHSGMKLRIKAWLEHRGMTAEDLADFRLIGEALPLLKHGDVSALIRGIEEVFPDRTPRLVVLDTQARCTEGVDENDAGEMGVVIGAADRIKYLTGSAVLLIHHTGHRKDHARGSTAVYGALNTQIVLEGETYSLQLTCKKQKDDEEFDPIHINLIKVADSLASVAKYPKRP